MSFVGPLIRRLKSAMILASMCAASTFGPNALGNEREDVIQLDETVISGNQELPKVLYIVPWQQPNGLPDIEVKHDFTETDVFRKLYPPAYKRELNYFQTLHAGRVKEAPSEK